MLEDNQKTISIDLNISELKHIRYYLYNIIIQDSIYHIDFVNFAKNFLKKIVLSIDKYHYQFNNLDLDN